MFTRRKIMLALLDACGGELTSIDMEKLLFLYCKENNKNHYDFFPCQYGCFSFMSYQDKRVFIKQGFLAESKDFILKKSITSLDVTNLEEYDCVKLFSNRTKSLRGKKLLRYVYSKYPYYAIKSKIKEQLLTAKELSAINSNKNNNSEISLMTIGYEGISIDAYINKLIYNNIALVVDVRRNPISMKYGFSKTRLRDYLNRTGIGYEHIPSLGIESSKRKNLATTKEYELLFRKYSEELLPKQEIGLNKIKQLITEYKRVALTCFEANPKSCHRHKITEYMQASPEWSIPIIHI